MQKQHFVRSDNLSNFFKSKINQSLEKRILKKFEEPYNSINLTECDRRILYRAYGQQCDINIFKDVNKDFLNKKWDYILSNIIDFKILHRDVMIANHDLNIVGNVDFICELNGRQVIICIHSRNLIESESKMTRKEIVDINIKMWISNIKHGILIIDNSNGLYDIAHVVPYKPIIHAVVNKCNKLELNRLNGVLINRPYNNKESKECSQCEYRDVCWKG